MKKEEMLSFARKNWVPVLRDKSADFLCKLVKDKQPKRILEIGTAIGYSGILMLENSNATLKTIEIDKTSAEQAKVNFTEAGLIDRVEIICADAKEIIENLNEKFDLIFLDGPKGQYLNYLPTLKKLLNKEGVLVADDIFYHGWVKGNDYPSHKHRTIIMRLREFNDKIINDPELDTTILDMEDGVSVSILK